MTGDAARYTEQTPAGDQLIDQGWITMDELLTMRVAYLDHIETRAPKPEYL